jgi:peptidoglycan-associated lipoprotein
MRTITALVASSIVIAVIFSGCDTDRRGIKVSPKTELDSQSDYGYQDDYYDTEAAGENRYGNTELPEEFKLITVYFDYDKFELTPEGLETMSTNADQLMSNPIKVILIEGHCDERGTEEYNLALGEKRAREVREYLVKYGIDPSRLSIVSYGESTPADYGHNEGAWAKNRRAEFTVISR